MGAIVKKLLLVIFLIGFSCYSQADIFHENDLTSYIKIRHEEIDAVSFIGSLKPKNHFIQFQLCTVPVLAEGTGKILSENCRGIVPKVFVPPCCRDREQDKIFPEGIFHQVHYYLEDLLKIYDRINGFLLVNPQGMTNQMLAKARALFNPDILNMYYNKFSGHQDDQTAKEKPAEGEPTREERYPFIDVVIDNYSGFTSIEDIAKIISHVLAIGDWVPIFSYRASFLEDFGKESDKKDLKESPIFKKAMTLEESYPYFAGMTHGFWKEKGKEGKSWIRSP